MPEADVMTIIESGELGAKKIGASYRVTRSALEKYLPELRAPQLQSCRLCSDTPIVTTVLRQFPQLSQSPIGNRN